MRAGIGRPPGRMNTADFVLKPFSTAEAKNLPFLISNAADAVRMLVEKGLVAAQQHYHSA
ncbi:peptidyl-tRNA hydrolase [Rothia aeria]|uniref:Peptidyl-tRNA hydrolase n=1 Tax=Rothia aeria TaxID=172042 RepID=A0A2Z5QYK4_9MICC|nr:peptidyl-tRNA hydrolase [Rothia aeria]